jgi:predicted glycoside hydrolase/deacetylase ChbG (UPF0249 family)
MDEGVDRAILALASRGIVTAASAMVLSPRWPDAARRLKDADADCGLHLDLTSPFAALPFSATGLARLIAKAYAEALPAPHLGATIERQLDLFERGLGRMPDFVDGHQHVHQLPGVRKALLGALSRRYGPEAKETGIRICQPRVWRGLKAHIVGALGGRRLAEAAGRSGHKLNSDFAGVYDFSPNADLRACWRRWLGALEGENPLAMCHIAESAQGAESDPIRPARLREYSWLGSEAFLELCAEHSVMLVRWPANAAAITA